MVAKKFLMTSDDLLRMPDDYTRHDLVSGELRTMPPASGARAGSGEPFGLLRDHVRAHRLGWVLAAETGF